jgi:hypothetical protein
MATSDAKMLDKVETVRFEKLLYFYCALKDLKEKCEPAEACHFTNDESSTLDFDLIKFVA